MVHYIIVKFSNEFNYLESIGEITALFNEALKIEGDNKINIYTSNSIYLLIIILTNSV